MILAVKSVNMGSGIQPLARTSPAATSRNELSAASMRPNWCPNFKPHALDGTADPRYFLISPFFNNRSRSCAPPTSTPFTNTSGKVGQPVHILSARRRRHCEK